MENLRQLEDRRPAAPEREIEPATPSAAHEAARMSNARQTLEAAELLAQRAAVLGKLPSGVVSALGSLKAHAASHTWAEEHSQSALQIISELSATLRPEDIESIKRRASHYYRSQLIAYTAVMVIFCFVVLYAIIHMTLLFSPINSVMNNVNTLAATNQVGKTIHEFEDNVRQEAANGCSDTEAPFYSKLPLSDECGALLKNFYAITATLDENGSAIDHNIDLIDIATDRLGHPDSVANRLLLFFAFEPNNLIDEKSKANDPKSKELRQSDIAVNFKSLVKRSSMMEPIAQLMGAHLLPLLYGMLGAAVYMLRSVNAVPLGCVNVTDSILECSLRIGLGGVAGLAIGWFNIGEEAGKLTTTPFAIAFVAGYSIDILFSLLERFINVFSSKPQT